MAARQQRKGRPGKAPRKPPAAVFAMSLIFLIVAMLVGGLRAQVALKRRTRQGDNTYMEDTADGTGQRSRVLVSSANTNGEYFTMWSLVRPTTPGLYQGRIGSPPPHYHTFQDESFLIKSGSFGCFYGSKDNVTVLHAGDSISIPKGVPHTFWNADNSTDLEIEFTNTPAGMGEQFYETLAGLGYDYGSAAAVSPLQMLLSLSRGGIVMTDVPPWLWKLVEHGVVPFTELIGYKAYYPQYRSKHEPVADS